jgi:hypothetical protein
MKLKIKYLPFLILLFVKINFCKGQINLVQNPSFESYSSCPNNYDELYKCSDWINSSITPDYFNSCASGSFVSVPNNFGGYRIAANGNAYIGLLTYVRPSLYFPNAREYASSQLTNDLIIGTKYFVSFSASLSMSGLIPSNCATNKLGVTFSKTLYTSISSPKLPDNIAKVFSSNKIIDTVNWVTIFGSFIADSAYSHILIGNFFTDNNTDTLIMDNLSTCDGSYYFVDKVCVSTDSLFTKNYLTTNIFNYNSKDKIKIYPKIITDVVNIENSNTEPYSIEITDMLGNLFFSKRNILRDNFIIDCSNFNPQILLIKINSNKYNYINKIVKQ